MAVKLCECGCGQETGMRRGRPNRFLLGHTHRKSGLSFIETPDTNCWLWQLAIDENGYGFSRMPGGGPQRGAHRVVYQELIGSIPEGLTLDHLCRKRSCVNPGHLEPVTMRENILRGDTIPARNAQKTHCIHGHPFDEANTYISPSRPSVRCCRGCHQERDRQRRQRKAAA